MALFLKNRQSTWLETAAFLTGILVFTFFITDDKRSVILALAGIGLSFSILVLKIKSGCSLTMAFGFSAQLKGKLLYAGISILAGLLLGMVYRQSLKTGVLPQRLVSFALLASLIGSTEELIFRGFMQTNLRKINAAAAVLISAAAHTIYKLVLFWSLDPGMAINFRGLVIWTFIGGVVFGIIRELSGNTVFPVISHAVFDVVVYGDNLILPWWIWS